MERAVQTDKIIEWLNTWAPFDSAEEWDNVGLLVGNATKPVTRVLTSLDITPSAVGQAVEWGAELIVSHHPVIFRSLSRLTDDGIPYLLAKSGLSAIAAHTNLDRAKGGVNDTLAARLGLRDISAAGDGLCRIGALAETMKPSEFAEWAGQALQVPKGGIQWMEGKRPVHTVGVCSGAGGEYLPAMLPLADAFVTGELHYHEWPFRTEATILAAGHFHTEVLAAGELAKRLREAFPSLTVKAAEQQCPYRQI